MSKDQSNVEKTLDEKVDKLICRSCRKIGMAKHIKALVEAEVKRKLSEYRFGVFSDKGLEEYLSDLEYEKQRRAALTQEKNNG